MTPKEKREAIAYHQGWESVLVPMTDDLGPIGDKKVVAWRPRHSVDPVTWPYTRSSPPDYLGSRDAMRLAWRNLDYNQQAEFGHYLAVVLFGQGLADGKLFGEHDLSRMAMASAEELAEAYGKTFKLW